MKMLIKLAQFHVYPTKYLAIIIKNEFKNSIFDILTPEKILSRYATD